MKDTIKKVSGDLFDKERRYKNKVQKRKFRKNGNLRRELVRETDYEQTHSGNSKEE